MELRPALEKLDRIVAASEGIDPGALTFAFRPLWQFDAATAATVALQKVQATQVYAGLNLWPAATTARLVQAQLAEDGTYPNASAVFGEGGAAESASASDTQRTADAFPIGAGLPHYAFEPRDRPGRWTTEGDDDDQAGPSTADPEIEEAGLGKGPGRRHDKRRGRMPALGRGAVFGGMGRFLRRLLPEGPEPDDTPSSKLDLGSTPASAPVTSDPKAAQKLDDALSDYQTRRCTIGNQTFQFDKAGMHDVLERHSPEYWDGVPKDTQTFFPKGTTVEQLQEVVADALNQNRDEIIADPSVYRLDFRGTSSGVRYEVVIYRGPITHLVPK